MSYIVGVRFRKSGVIKYFDTKEADISLMRIGSHLLVESERGPEYGTVMMPPRKLSDDYEKKFPAVLRTASPEDDAIYEENLRKEKDACRICKERIAYHGLLMKLVDTEYSFDRSKLLFYFTADGRVDFRELVKDLASEFRIRIELRQIGVRDEANMVGGFGICGRELCCSTYMSNFAPVSIKMAKEQNLSLNPVKISGACGRLMCCLKNEEETYEYLNSQLPNVGSHVQTIDGYDGVVSEVSVLRQRVKVTIEVADEKELRDYSVKELKFQQGHIMHEISEEEKELFLKSNVDDNVTDLTSIFGENESAVAVEKKTGKPKSSRKPKGDFPKKQNKQGSYFKEKRQDKNPETPKDNKEKMYSKKVGNRRRNFNRKSRHKGGTDES